MSGSGPYQLSALPVTIFRLSDGAAIPADPSNSDWQRFLTWQAAGNVPTAAPVVANPVTILSSTYMGRFTTAELLAWENYVLTHSTTSQQIILGATVGGATWAWIWTVLTGPTVTLTDPATVTAHAALVSAGILTAARSTAILTP
nr:hypothetical protein [uncultured Lichenicoccus sp.]